MRSRSIFNYSSSLLIVVMVLLLAAGLALGQSSSFTYQGRLTDAGTAANGNYDLQFTLWDSVSGGTQIGSTQTLNTVAVSNGTFTVSLDFGAGSFPGANRFLEISARPSGGGSFTLLAPRQQVTSTPYSVRSLSAALADNVSVTGIPSGNGNYIQNTTNVQSSTNFNVSGNGTVGGTLSGNIVSAATQFNLGSDRVLSISGTQNSPNTNLFVGLGAGQSNNGAVFNTFVGQNAGKDTTSGSSNSFFGQGAGVGSTSGSGNTFIGVVAGTTLGASVTSSFNTFLGYGARIGDFGLTRPSITNATAIGAGAHVDQSNSIVLGSILGSEGTADTNVGIGTQSPSNRLDIDVGHAVGDPGITIQGVISSAPDIGLRIKNTNAGNEWYIDSTGTGSSYGAGNLAFAIKGVVPAALIIHPSGSIELSHLGNAGGTPLCLNGQSVIAACSSSLRYKKDIAAFHGGLDIISRLRPISFTWKQDGMKDIGFGAEEVDKVAPSFTFRNDKGEIEGVRYDRLGVLFVNAFKEQQAQIEELRAELKREQEQITRQEQQARQERAAFAAQQHQLTELKKLVCSSHRRASACR